MNNGSIIGNFTKSHYYRDKHFQNAYEFIKKHMPSRKKDDIIKENDSPIWYFADKRHTNGMFIPDNSIIFEVEIPLDELLLTHYDAYHCVLNDFPCYGTDDISDEEFEASMENFNNSRYYTKDEYELAKYNSWEKYVIMSKDNINYSVLQALSWRLYKSQVINTYTGKQWKEMHNLV